MNVDSLNNQITVRDTAESFYYNFKPLSDFVSLIDFTQSYIPNRYYGDTTDFIESYFLMSIDSLNAFGWIHNINKYWANSFYWDNSDTLVENYYGCETYDKPNTSFIISDFKANNIYYIYFFRTRNGVKQFLQQTPFCRTIPGSLIVDLSYSPLGCDSVNADYAFFIS